MDTQSLLADLQSFVNKAVSVHMLMLFSMNLDLLRSGEQAGQSRLHQSPLGSKTMSTIGVKEQRLHLQGRPRRARRALAQCQIRKRQCKNVILF